MCLHHVNFEIDRVELNFMLLRLYNYFTSAPEVDIVVKLNYLAEGKTRNWTSLNAVQIIFLIFAADVKITFVRENVGTKLEWTPLTLFRKVFSANEVNVKAPAKILSDFEKIRHSHSTWARQFRMTGTTSRDTI